VDWEGNKYSTDVLEFNCKADDCPQNSASWLHGDYTQTTAPYKQP